MSPLKKFFLHYSHFISGNVLSQLLGLITFPILTRILTREQYGIMGLVITTMLIAVAISKAGLSDGIIRFYREYSNTQDQLTLFSSTVIIRGVLLSVLAVLLYITIFPIISNLLNINKEFILCFIIMAIYLFFRPLNMIVLNFLRALGKTIFLNLTVLIEKMISIAFSLFLLIYVFQKLYGYFIGIVMAEIFVSVILFYWFLTHYKIKFSKISRELTIKLIKFGAPLLLTELSYLILSYADRYMIIAYLGEDALGLYSVGYNLAMYLANVLMISLTYAVIPIYVEVYTNEGKQKTEKFLQRSVNYLLIAIIPISIGYFAISKNLFIVLSSEKYAIAATFSPIILIGTFFLGMNNIFNAGLYLKRKTMTILVIMLIAVIINIIMNIILLPEYEVMGAAVATLISCIITTILTVFLSFKYIVVKINSLSVIYYILWSGVMYFALKRIEIATEWKNLIAQIVIGGLITILAILLREKEILEIIKGKIRLKIV